MKKIVILLLSFFVAGLVYAEADDKTIKEYEKKCETALASKNLAADEKKMAVLNCVIELIDLAAKK